MLEAREPGREAWRGWTRDRSQRSVEVTGAGRIETWVELTDVELPFASFTTTFVFHADGEVVRSTSTLRFRSRAEVERSQHDAGFEVAEVGDAPDRPGRELVFIARATTPR